MSLEEPRIHDDLRAWLTYAVESGASDLHLICGNRPLIRLHGVLTELPGPVLIDDQLDGMLRGICSPEVLVCLQEQKNVDFSFDLPMYSDVGRFRTNLFLSAGLLGGCFRVIPSQIPDFDWAGFPASLAERLISLRDGLVIVTGATGSGKTTTLAMIVNRLNQKGGFRIITVEEPVEYLFPKAANSALTQREVGRDVLTFADGLKYGLRQDPDVILVGEIRDHETAQMALSAAETGHLVFSTLHTRDAKGAITRYSDLFPPHAQHYVRSKLAMSLRTIVSQRLLPDAEGEGKRHLALEILWNSNPIASAIRQWKLESIDNYLVTGRDLGMVTFDESVRRLLLAGRISREVAERNVNDVSLLHR
jgi:twitching motility protein PilT